MAIVIATQSFDHAGSRRRGDKFSVSDATAQKLWQKGLVSIAVDEGEKSGPRKAAGKQSSASPAAPASRRKIVKKSEPGDPPAAAEGSLL